ncbi:MAG: ArnT family glycosyltransferase [Thermoanaerobaculia bacterium]
MDHTSLLGSLGLLLLASVPPLALGWRVQEALGAEESGRPRLGLLLAAGLGFGITSLAVAALGLAGCLGRGALIGVLALEAAAGGIRGWAGLARALRREGRQAAARAREFPSLAFGSVVAAILGLAWIVSCAPLSGSDAMAYHFAIPKLYAAAGRIFEISWSDYSYLLGNGHMLILLGIGLSGSRLALGLCWLPAVFSALATLEIAGRRLPARWSALAAAATVSAPLFFWQMSAAGAPDLWTTFFTLMAAISLLEFRAGSRLRWAAAAGVFGGLAAGCKYPVWSVVIVGAILLLLWTRKPGKAVFLFLSAAVLVGGWHLLLNVHWTGDPFFPYAAEVFSPSRGALLSAQTTAKVSRAAGFSLSPLSLLAYPIRLTLDGRNWGVGEMFGPIVLTLLPVVLIRAWRERDFDLLFFGTGFFALNAVTSQMARFLLPVFPIFIVLSIEALRWLRTGLRLPKARAAAFAAVLLALAWSLGSDVVYARPFLGAALVPAGRNGFLRQWASNFSISEWLNRRLAGERGRVMVFYRHTSYLDVDYVSGDPEHSAPMDPGAIRNGQDLRALLAGSSIAWVVEDDEFPLPIRGAFEDLIRRGDLRLVDRTRVDDVAGMRGTNRRREVALSLWRFKRRSGIDSESP